MKMDFQPKIEPQEVTIEVHKEYEPRILPVENKGEVFLYGDDEYIPEKSGTVEKVWKRHFDGRINKYVLVSEIASLEYLLRLSGEEGTNPYGLSFKTLKYEYATTNLDDESSQILFEILADFLETAHSDSEEKIRLIDISPADSSYSALEIEDCIGEILKKTNKFSENDLREKYKGYMIFDLYSEIMGKNYNDLHYNGVSRANPRSRYFKMKFKKYLKNWKIDESSGRSTSFCLKRKD